MSAEIKYKLKKEARQFFEDKYHDRVLPLKVWTKEGIHKNLLDELPRAHVVLGQKKIIDEKTEITNIGGWSGIDNSSRIHFTIHVNEITYDEHKRIKFHELMDEIQKVIDKHFKQ